MGNIDTLTRPAWWLLLLAAGACIPASAQERTQQQLSVYQRGSASSSAEQEQRLKRLQSGALAVATDFDAKAQIGFKTESRAMVKTTPLVVGEAAADVARGWESQGRQLWSWRAAQGDNLPLTLRVTADKGNVRLEGSDEIWVDYSTVAGIPECTPRIDLDLLVHGAGRASGGERAVATTIAPSGLEPLTRLDLFGAVWREKGLAYIAAREMGLAPGDAWFFSQDGPNAVLQRRTDLSLAGAEMLQVALSPGMQMEQVNLRVAWAGGPRNGVVLQFGSLRDSTLVDGKPGAQLRIREALQNVEGPPLQAGRELRLKEIIVFMPGQGAAMAQAYPIRDITLLGPSGLGPVAAGQPPPESMTLPTRVVGLGGDRHRLVADVRALVQRGALEVRQVFVRMLPNMDACATRLGGVALAADYVENIPSFAANVESWIKRWGDVPDVGAREPGNVEAPGLLGHIFMGTFSAPEPRASDVAEYSLPLPYRILAADGKELVPTSQLVSSTGASIMIDGEPLRRVTAESTALTVEGRSRSLEISWPIATTLRPGTWFLMLVTEGAEDIASMTVTLELADGSRLDRAVLPNHPQHLVDRESEVRGVKVVLATSGKPFRMRLNELALFEPHAVAYAKALSVPIPGTWLSRPRPDVAPGAAAPLVAKPGRITGLIAPSSDEPVRFSSVLDLPLDAITGIRLKYRVPLSAMDGTCNLVLQLNWMHGPMQRQVCFQKAAGEIYIPFANLLGATARPPVLGPLRSIDWVLRPGSGRRRLAVEAFELDFSIDGSAQLSALDEIRTTAMLRVGEIPVYPDSATLAQLPQRPYSQKVWLPLAPEVTARALAPGSQLQPFESRWSQLEEVALEPRTDVPLQRWKEFVDVPSASRISPASRLTGLLALAATAAVLWLSWRGARRWISRRAKARPRSPVARQETFKSPRLAKLAPLANAAVGVIGFAGAVLAAGRLGVAYPGMMLIAAGSLLAWGAYARWRNASRTQDRVCMEWPIGQAIGAGGLLWGIGRFGIGVESAWGLLPLVASLYVLPASLARMQSAFRSGAAWSRGHLAHLSLAGWIVAALVLYARDSNRVADADNVALTLAALSVVLAVRSLLRVLEPYAARLIPTIHPYLYREGGNLYFAVAVMMLVLLMASLAVRSLSVSDQLGIMVYFSILLGIGAEIITRRRAISGVDGEA